MFLKILNIVLLFMAGMSPETIVNDYLTEKLTAYDKFEFEIVNGPKDLSGIILDDSRDFKLTGSTGYIPVKIVYGDKQSASYLSVKLRLYKYALVALSDIKKGDELKSDNFDLALTEITKLNGTLFENPGELEEYKARYTIKQSNVLMKEYLESIPVIAVGDKVTANVQSGMVVVSTDAFARQEGGKGDVIVIRTIDNKQFRAEIINRNNVLILE